MTTPGSYTLTLYRGDTGHWQFRLWADAEHQTPVDLEGASAAAQLRDTFGMKLIEFACTIEGNTVDMLMTPELSQRAANGRWDLQITYADGTVQTILAGPVVATGDVTRVVAA